MVIIIIHILNFHAISHIVTSHFSLTLNFSNVKLEILIHLSSGQLDQNEYHSWPLDASTGGGDMSELR